MRIIQPPFIWTPEAAAEETGYLILPDPRFEMPELFIPGKKPVGKVEIDWTHPLARGLIFFNMPGAGPHQYYDLTGGAVTGLNPNLLAGDVVAHDNTSLFGNGFSGSGGEFTPSNGAHSTTGFHTADNWDITLPHTLAAVVRKPVNVTASGDWIVPIALTSNSSYRYSTLEVHGDTNSNQREIKFGRRFTGSAVIGPQLEESENGGIVTGDVFSMVGVLYGDSDARLFLSSGASKQDVTSHSGGPYYLREISVGDHWRNGVQGIGDPTTRGNGSSMSMAAAWNRALSPIEAAAFNADPYQFLIPA